MAVYDADMLAEEAKLLKKVSVKNLMKKTEEIAKWVRISSTREEVESLEYLKKEYDAIGFKTEIIFYKAFISYPVHATVTMKIPYEKAFKGISQCFTPSTQTGGLEGEICEGYGSCKGKIALFDGLGFNAARLLKAQDLGAVGIILIHDENIHNGPVSDIWGNPTEEMMRYIPRIPIIAVNKNDGDVLRGEMKKQAVFVNMESVMVREWLDCPILIADLKSDYSDKFLLFSGHIDSWDYGAMDNGGANSTMLECARLVASKKDKLRRGLRIAYWSGHSHGKYAGSAWYADHHFEELEKNCVGHLNIDSVGGIGATVIEEPPVMAQAWELAKDVIEGQNGVKFKGKRMARNADQSFFGVGLTSIFGTFSEQDITKAGDSFSFRFGSNSRAGGLGWWWHTEHDTMDKLDPAFMVRDTRIYLAVAWRILVSPVLPYDFAAAVKEMQDTVSGLQNKLAGIYDFSSLISRLDEIQKRLVLFKKKISAASGKKEQEALIDLQLKLSRIIVRLVYHKKECYEFDLCGALYPLPSLEVGEKIPAVRAGSELYHMRLVELQKGYNRVMGYCKDILEILK